MPQLNNSFKFGKRIEVTVSLPYGVYRHLCKPLKTSNINDGEIRHRTEKLFSLSKPSTYAESESVSHTSGRVQSFSIGIPKDGAMGQPMLKS